MTTAAFLVIGALALLASVLLWLLLRATKRNGRLEKRIATMQAVLDQKDRQLRDAAAHRAGDGGAALGTGSF